MTEFEKKFKEKVGEDFNSYYKKHLPKLTWYLTRYTKNIELSEEFANIAFVQGLEKIDSYNNELSKYITWLTTIAVNLVIKNYKDNKRLNLVSMDKHLRNESTLTDFLHYDTNEDDRIISEEIREKSNIIKNVIYTLPEKYKKVMILRELHNKPYKEIANTIKKEYEININTSDYMINKTNDLFHSVTVTNYGDNDINIEYSNTQDIVVPPNTEKIFLKDDIIDNIKIKPNNNNTKIKIVETTNLSTIKSQIKKGRLLIRRKVKKNFKIIEENGL